MSNIYGISKDIQNDGSGERACSNVHPAVQNKSDFDRCSVAKKPRDSSVADDTESPVTASLQKENLPSRPVKLNNSASIMSNSVTVMAFKSSVDSRHKDSNGAHPALDNGNSSVGSKNVGEDYR